MSKKFKRKLNDIEEMINDKWEANWDNPVSQELRTRANVPEECKNCNQLGLCSGGCPLSFYREEYIWLISF